MLSLTKISPKTRFIKVLQLSKVKVSSLLHHQRYLNMAFLQRIMMSRLITSSTIRKLSISNASKMAAALSFDLSEEQKLIQETARKFAKEEIMPIAAYHDRTREFPGDVLKKAFQVGLMNILVPTEYGGAGLSYLELCLASEELAYGCAGIMLAIGISNLAQISLGMEGNEAQKKKYLGRMTEEMLLTSYAVTEATGGSDVAAVKTSAEKKGDAYVLNGEKMWITGAGVANWFYVLARTNPDPKAPAANAFTALIVEADTPGLKVGRNEPLMGHRASDTRGVKFEDVLVPKENVLGGEGNGFRTTMRTFDRARVIGASVATGLAQRALDEALKYALERSTFGCKIIEHQSVASMLADMAIGVENARLVYMRSAWELSRGVINTYMASIAKTYASETAYKCASDAVQILGANGYSQDYPVEKLMRDAKVMQIFEGTSQIQRLIIAKELAQRVRRT